MRNRRQVSLLLTGMVMLGGLVGCCANNNRARYIPPPPGMNNGPMPPRYVPNPSAVLPGPNPSGVLTPPPGAVTMPPGAVLQPPGQASSPAGAEIQQNNYIPPGPSASPPPQPVAPSVYLEQPEPVAAEPTNPMPNVVAPQPETRPYTPQTSEPPMSRDDRAASPTLPVDIPQFAAVKPNIAGGQEPFSDGVTWLKKHGYRTVLHVRAPGADDNAARKEYEQVGLRYVSLELSPQTLSKDIVDKFSQLIDNGDNLPLFVYDKDGSLAGALWYLHFRLVDRTTEEKARDEAERLGFKQERGEAHLKMWLAVQKLLKDLNP